MKRYFLIISILTLTSFLVDAQTTDNISKREFKNQGEQEDYWAEQLFKNEYCKTHFDKYKGDIVINANSFIFGDKTFVIVNTPNELKPIFSSGIFYPAIITGDTKSVVKSQAELDTLSTAQKVFYNMTRTDSLTISGFEELKFLTKSNTQKRFRFWLFRKGTANPTVCFIELTNDKAHDKTDLTTFIDGAVLTFFKSGWIVI
jgi:hypothetical protein